MNNPTPYVLLFIALIGLVYILSTCDWKPSSEQTDPTDSVHGNNDDGNSGSHFPEIAKAHATSHQSDFIGTEMTMECPNTIKKITMAKYKWGDSFTDITDTTDTYCRNKQDCTLKMVYDNSKISLIARSATEDTKTYSNIRDPSPGNGKTLDISYSCESDQAQSIFIKDKGYNTTESKITCQNQETIHIESAEYRDMYADHRVDVTSHLNLCNGENTCTIIPTGLDRIDHRNHEVYFAIQDKRDCDHFVRNSGGWKNRFINQDINNNCPTVEDFAYGHPKELAIVYYCRSVQARVVIQCPSDTDTIKEITNAEYNCDQDINNKLQSCVDKSSCTIQSEHMHVSGNTYLNVDGVQTEILSADDASGCSKILDMSFSCYSVPSDLVQYAVYSTGHAGQAQYVTVQGTYVTVYCRNEMIKMDSAKYGSETGNQVDVLNHLTPMCDGYETCIITSSYDRYSGKIQFLEKSTVDSSRTQSSAEISDPDLGPDSKVELNIVYYCYK